MAFKCVILAALLAVANAGLLGGYAAAPVAYGSIASPVAYGAVASPVAYGSIASPVAYGSIASPVAYGAVASPALVSQQSNILRTPGNLGQVSTYSKTINTPYSSVSKSDVRVSNDALAYSAYGAPIAARAYAAPLAARAYGAPIAAGGLLGVAYSAAPAVAHMTYTNGLGLSYAY